MEQSKLTKEQFLKAGNNEEVQGLVLLRSYGTKPMRNGGFYLDGTIMCEGVYKFKVWPGSVFDCLVDENITDKVCFVHGKVSEYGETRSLIINSLSITENDISDFLETPYNVDTLTSTADSLLASLLSDKGMGLYNHIKAAEVEIFERFPVEFAANSHHDNCLHGVFAHSIKMLQILYTTLYIYPNLVANLGYEDEQDAIDLLALGVLCHDIGKTIEMHYGIYQPNSAVSHRFFGAELLCRHKEIIVELYSEKWFYDFVSIMLQHHGEYGDPCRTVVAKVVHLIDFYESQICSIASELETGVMKDAAGDSIRVSGDYLRV